MEGGREGRDGREGDEREGGREGGREERRCDWREERTEKKKEKCKRRMLAYTMHTLTKKRMNRKEKGKVQAAHASVY